MWSIHTALVFPDSQVIICKHMAEESIMHKHKCDGIVEATTYCYIGIVGGRLLKSEQFAKFLGNTAIPRSSHDREVSFAAQQENVYHPVFDTNLAVNL